MKPGKIGIINKKVSEKTGMKLETVTLINDFYWTKIKTMINELYNDEIYLHSLGSFKVRPHRIDEFIRNTENLRKYHVEKQQLNMIELSDFTLARLLDFKAKYKDRLEKKNQIKGGHIQDLEK